MAESSDREISESTGDRQRDLTREVERTLRRGNINFDFLNPVQLPPEAQPTADNRREAERAGKRGLFNRGFKPRVMPGWYTWLWLLGAMTSAAGLILVWKSDHFIALLAVPFLLSAALASLIMLGLFLARPR